MNSTHNGFSSLIHSITMSGWEVVNIKSVHFGSNYYARKEKE